VLIFNEQASVLARRLDEYAKQGSETHDLYSCISACTLDIIVGSLECFFSTDDMKYMFDDDDCRDRNRHKSECSVK
jgi:hypothetical protein